MYIIIIIISFVLLSNRNFYTNLNLYRGGKNWCMSIEDRTYIRKDILVLFA